MLARASLRRVVVSVDVEPSLCFAQSCGESDVDSLIFKYNSIDKAVCLDGTFISAAALILPWNVSLLGAKY